MQGVGKGSLLLRNKCPVGIIKNPRSTFAKGLDVIKDGMAL